MTGKWLVFQAILLEAAGIAAFFELSDPVVGLWVFVFSHLCASLLFSLFIWQLLPARYKRPVLPTFVALATIQFAIPVLGPVGTVLGLLLALYLPRHKHAPPWRQVAIPELPYQPIDISSEVLYSHGGLTQVLREANDPDKRLKAVMASKHINPRDHVRILREALKDSSDDVRLLAYGMLDGKEKLITERINKHQRELQKAEGRHRFRLTMALAQDYWEMAYLGLAQGGVKQHFLNKALELLEPLVEHPADAMACRMMGRIHLEMREWNTAYGYFLRAMALGIEQKDILPYLAETVFRMGHYQKVQEYVERYVETGTTDPGFLPVKNYWLGGNSVG